MGVPKEFGKARCQFIIEALVFGSNKERRTVWDSAELAVVLRIWLEQNVRNFRQHVHPSLVVVDRILFIASLWVKAKFSQVEFFY